MAIEINLSEGMVSRLKNILPFRMISAARAVKVHLENRRYRHMTATETFDTVYKERKWGGIDGYYSGSGSEGEMVGEYIALVKQHVEIKRLNTIVDLGCGDFRVGSALVEASPVHYIGVDVVPGLIDHNKRAFAVENVEFRCLDIIADSLPEGDLCLLRQVFQHLSNREIMQILSKLKQYPYVIITEHIPIGKKIIPNRDKVHGPDTRLYFNSGVFIEKAPFNILATTVLEVLQPFNGRNAAIRSSLIENF